MSLDIRILEVLVSRICHDLISPIFAVSNGAELVADMGGVTAGADDAFDLIRTSAVAASIKLQAFRLAYGAGGSEWHVSMDDVQKTFTDLIGLEPRYKSEWGLAGANLPQPLPRGMPKLAMLSLMWAMESLPKGGLVRISAVNTNGFSLVIEAIGNGATLREGTMDAFLGKLPSEELTPKTVHAAATGHYASSYGIKIVPAAPAPDHVSFTLSV